MDDRVNERIEPYGIRLSRPDWWEFRLEQDARPTWLYWDEDCGSLRITPWREQPGFSLDGFLAATYEAERAKGHAPRWQTLGARRWVCWMEDGDATKTRSHFSVTGEAELVVLCSFAYSHTLLEDAERDEYYADLLADALDEVTATLESLAIS